MIDSSLAVLIVLTALYAGAVTLLVAVRRGDQRGRAWAATRATLGVVAAFALMIVLAHVALPAVFAVVAIFTYQVTVFTLRPDLDQRRAALAGVAAAILIGVSFAFVSYLAVIALIGAAGVYQILRLRLRTRPALVVMGGTLGTLLAAAGLTFAVALATM